MTALCQEGTRSRSSQLQLQGLPWKGKWLLPVPICTTFIIFFYFFFNSFFHCFHALERFESLSTHKMQALQYWVLQHPQVAPSGPRAVPSLTPTPKRQALRNATSASSLGMQTPQPGNR